MLLWAFSASAHDYDFTVGGICYSINDSDGRDACKVVRGHQAYAGDIIIPSEVMYRGKTYRVVSIAEKSFAGCRGLKSIKIGGLTSIGESAFADCKGLTRVHLSNITHIGSKAFSGCTGLTDLRMSNITHIGDNAF